MINRPPKEGSRWGADPSPEPVFIPETEGPPKEYLNLCNKYGERNVTRALEVRSHIQNQYPHLPILRDDPLTFADSALQNAQWQMQRAAADGRPHSMPETLDLMQKYLGDFCMQHPDRRLMPPGQMVLSYGDEEKGKAAKETLQKKEMSQLAVVVAIPSFIIGVIAESQRGGLEFLSAFIVSGIIIGAILFALGALGKLFSD
jgi:hypothetical protein